MRGPLLALLVAAAVLPPSAAATVPAPPMRLPAAAGSAGVTTWLVGARPGTEAARIARAHGARRVLGGTVQVALGRARELAAALDRRGLLLFAEPDRLSRRAQEPAPRAVPDDPLSPQARWRDHVADPALAPPAVTPESPLLVLIDSPAQGDHPEFAGGALTTGNERVLDFHGTGTAAVAAAPVNGTGITGVWPGMRAANVALPSEIRCADSARAIMTAIAARPAVINMSYGSSSPCFTEFLALQAATEQGITLVAAAGNEFEAGNQEQFPASLPHVLTVAAATPEGRAAFFSNENAAIDLSAPGVGILTAVPVAFDPDATKDGWALLDGTSFAAPMAAAAAAWVRAVRPTLRVDQVAQVLRLGTRDLGETGWEPSTGFGMLDVGRALEREAPPADPREPNEDVLWVDGRAFGDPDRPIGSRLFAMLDVYEDPSDVYRLRIPAGRRAVITVRPRFGDPDLDVFSARVRNVGARPLDRSARRGKLTETVRVRNTSRRKRTVLLQVYVQPGRAGLDSAYDLRVKFAR